MSVVFGYSADFVCRQPPTEFLSWRTVQIYGGHACAGSERSAAGRAVGLRTAYAIYEHLTSLCSSTPVPGVKE